MESGKLKIIVDFCFGKNLPSFSIFHFSFSIFYIFLKKDGKFRKNILTKSRKYDLIYVVIV